MMCRHGVTGPCAQCARSTRDAQILHEVARLVAELAHSHGLDASRLRTLMGERREVTP